MHDSVGKRVKAARRRRRIKQGELARLAGTNTSTVYRLETGKTRAPHVDTLKALAAALSVPVQWLEHGIGDDPLAAELPPSAHAAPVPRVVARMLARAPACDVSDDELDYLSRVHDELGWHEPQLELALTARRVDRR